MTLYNFLENELRFASEKLIAYKNSPTQKYRAEHIYQLTHVIEYLEDRIDDFKRGHAL